MTEHYARHLLNVIVSHIFHVWYTNALDLDSIEIDVLSPALTLCTAVAVYRTRD